MWSLKIHKTLLKVLIASACSFWMDYRSCGIRIAARNTEDMIIALRAAEVASETTRAAFQEEQRRAVDAALERVNQTKQADGVIATAQIDPARIDCEWPDDERLLVQELYNIFSYASQAHADGVPDPLG